MEYILAGGIVLPSLFQGGFYPSVFLLAGMLWAVLWEVNKKAVVIPAERFLWGVSILYIVASLTQGVDLTSLSQACLPAVGACFLRYWLIVPQKRRERFLELLTFCTGIMAIVGILAVCGILDILGAVSSHRIQFPFQYANAAGSWFAAVSLAYQRGEGAHWTRLPILTALLLTQSVGAIGLYGILLLTVLWKSRKEKDFLWNTILRHAVAALFALGFLCVSKPVAYLLLAGLLLAVRYETRLLARVHLLRWPCLALGVAGVSYALVSHRGTGPLGTFAERLVQISDGFSLILAHPLLGTGAGNWAYYYPRFQSAQYASTVVHSSVIQVAVDAGIFAAVLWIAFMICAWRGQEREPNTRGAALLLILHSMLDFTLQFYPIFVLLLALLFFGQQPEQTARRVGQRIALTLSILLFFATFCVEQWNKQVIYRAQEGDWQGVVSLCEKWEPMSSRCRKTRTLYVCGLYYTADLEGVLELTESTGELEEQAILMRANALREVKDTDSACEFILSELRSRLHQINLFTDTARLLQTWNAGAEYLKEYDKIAALANESCTILGTWMGNQVDIEYLE